MYSDLIGSLTGYKSGEVADHARIGKLRQHIKGFKRLVKATLEEHCELSCLRNCFICWIMW